MSNLPASCLTPRLASKLCHVAAAHQATAWLKQRRYGPSVKELQTDFLGKGRQDCPASTQV